MNEFIRNVACPCGQPEAQGEGTINTDEIKARIRSLVQQYFSDDEKALSGRASARVPIAVPTFGWEEVWEAIESLLSTNVTMGAKVRQFERLFAQYRACAAHSP